jgi:hypothetical protein
MSRGLGKVQRSVMDVLSRGGGLTSFDLAAQVYGAITLPDGRCSVSNAQRAAVRRALSSLQRRGLAFQCGRTHQGRAVWMTREQAEHHAESMPAILGTRSAVRRAQLARARRSPLHSGH